MVYQSIVDIYEEFDKFQCLLNIVSEERKIKISKYIFSDDKKRSLLSEVLLRYKLCKHYGFNNNEIKIGYGRYGKPYLINDKKIFFNISHSGRLVYCGFGDSPLGVDIELIKDNHLDIAKSIYNENEYRYIKEHSISMQKDIFYKLWTLKESYVKAVGEGMNISFRTFYFELSECKPKLFVNGHNETAYQFFSSKLEEDYYISLCVKNETDDFTKNYIEKVTIHQLAEYFYNHK